MRFAIEGGTPRFPLPIEYGTVVLPGGEILRSSIDVILASGRLNKGPWIERFEEKMAGIAGTADAVLFSSGSAALSLLLRALSIEGIAILPSFIFPPVAHAVRDGGPGILFADVSPRHWMMGAAEALVAEASAGGEPASVLIGFHLFGSIAPVGELEELAAERRIPLVFDAAHGFGGSWNGKPCGSFGDAEIFSLTPSKLVTGGEGGVVTTNDRSLGHELRILRNYGKDDDGEFTRVGMSARPTEIGACLAHHSLSCLARERRRRLAVIEAYRRALRDVAGVDVPEALDGTTPSGHEFALRVRPGRFGLSRDRLREILLAENVECRALYRTPPNLGPQVLGMVPPGGCPVAESLSSELLLLPLSADVEPNVAEQIVRLIEQVGAAARRHAIRGEEAR